MQPVPVRSVKEWMRRSRGRRLGASLLGMFVLMGRLYAAMPVTTNSLGMEMAAIPAGTFVMGQNQGGDWDERPAHEVTILRGFRISTTEVTLEQYRRFRPQYDCSFDGKVTGVSWYDAQAFCEWLSKREGKTYRLPTEAEWEYACRAGTTTPFWSGDAPPPDPNAANPWGLKGTCDSVVEWCYDWYGPYPARDLVDPVGADSGMVKVVRGDKPDDDVRVKDEKGRQPADYHRSANRAGLPPEFGLPAGQGAATENASAGEDRPGCDRVGFRVVEGAMPATAPWPAVVPFVRLCVQASIPQLNQAPEKPYFRKRYLLPIPPDDRSSDEAIADAGLPPSFRFHNHSPGMEVCPNGDVLLVIYTSWNEYEPGVSLIAARLRFGEDQWDMPEPMFDTPDVNDHAPMLWTDWPDKGEMYFFWGWPRLARGAFPFQWMTSADSGATWSPVQFPVFTGPIGPHSRQPINTALRAADGTIYVASDAKGGSSVLWATHDQGRTWYDTGGRTGGRHTTFALRSDGSILGMGGKSTDIEGYMPKSISHDGGKTWEVSKTPFPALGSNQRPSLLRLRSGRLLFAGDFQKRGNIAPAGVTNRGCYVALSDDGGETWRIKKLPGTQPHERFPDGPDTLGYSVARQAPNGMIHLITTMTGPCLDFEFNEAWILSDAPTPGSDVELMRSKATRVSKVDTFVEKYSNGRVRMRWHGGVADDGRFLKQGREECYFENGRREYRADFELGRPVGTETLWRPDGSVVWRWKHRKDGSGVWTQYWEDGRKKSESTWRNFKAEGKAIRWDREGRKISDVEFANGFLH